MTDQELIEKVAIEVMGWKKDIRRVFWINQEHGIKAVYNDQFFIVSEASNENYLDIVKPWNPLTNANHWMMVVERMRELGWSCQLELRRNGGNRAEFYNLTINKSYWFESMDETIGTEVCLAALEAVMK